MEILLFIFGLQFLLPLLIPRGKWLVACVLLYSIAWVGIWTMYNVEVSQDPMNADSRGLTGGLFFFSNVSFSIGLILRLLFLFFIYVANRWRSRSQDA